MILLMSPSQPAEYMSIEDTYAPMVHRVNQAVRHRAVRPTEPITPPADILIKYSLPPSDLVSDSAQELNNLVKAADVKKGMFPPLNPFCLSHVLLVPPKAKGKRRRETINPVSGLDIEAILGREKRQKISAENSVAGFKQMLAASEDDDNTFQQAVKQLGSIVLDLLKKSNGDDEYERALENIRVMREEMNGYELPGIYNTFLTDLKEQIKSEELGSGRNDFMYALRKNHLGLIDNAEAESSKVSKSEAAEVCTRIATTIARLS
jgi:ATP-dependent DNA helicase 2 subunit 2